MVGHKSYAAKLMQEIVENGTYKNLRDIKAALSKFETMEGFQAYYEPFPYGAFPRAPTSDEVRKCEALCRDEIKLRYLRTRLISVHSTVDYQQTSLKIPDEARKPPLLLLRRERPLSSIWTNQSRDFVR